MLPPKEGETLWVRGIRRRIGRGRGESGRIKWFKKEKGCEVEGVIIRKGTEGFFVKVIREGSKQKFKSVVFDQRGGGSAGTTPLL